MAQESAAAKKTVAEAAEISARHDKILAEANKLAAEASQTNHLALEAFLENLDRIASLPEALQRVALAHPAVADVVERLKDKAEQLRVVHGAIVAPEQGQLTAPTEAVQGKPTQ